MLSDKKVKELVDYWMDSSQEKFKTMQGLYDLKRYADCLFFGHLILEKILKALIVKNKKKHAPYGHNLINLAGMTNVEIDKKELEFLAEINAFNIQARYPDEQLEFYKRCNKKYADKYYSKINTFYKKLCRLVK